MIAIMMPPLSLAQIRDSAARLRNILGIPEDSYVDIVKIMDNLPDTFGVVVEIVPIQEMGEKHGETYPAAKKIRLREDVYDRACQGYGRDRLTLAHELAHLILHGPKKIALARVSENTRVPAYCDSEWQANTFAGEFLAPYRFARAMTEQSIQSKYGVSAAAAHVQKSRRG